MGHMRAVNMASQCQHVISGIAIMTAAMAKPHIWPGMSLISGVYCGLDSSEARGREQVCAALLFFGVAQRAIFSVDG